MLTGYISATQTLNLQQALILGSIIRVLIFSTFFYWSCGNDVMDMLGENADIFPGNVYYPKSNTALYGSWTPQNPNAKAPIVEADHKFQHQWDNQFISPWKKVLISGIKR